LIVWNSLNNNYGVTQFYHGLPYPDGATYFGGTQDNGTNRGSDAGGPNGWTRLIGGDGGYVAVDPANTSVLYGETTNLSLRKSTDSGATFKSATDGITEPSSQFGFITPFVMDPASSQRLWIGGRMPWRTTDGGTTWSQAGSAFTTGNFPATAIAVAPTDGNYVLFGLKNGFVSRTTTALTNTSATDWAQVLPTPVQAYNSWLTFDPANKNVAYATFSTFGVPHVWKSTDAGATWASINGSGSTGIPDIPVHCIVVNPGSTDRLYVGTDLGVFTSTDGGGSWLVENTGFANVVTEALALSGTSLFAFTHGRGAFRVALASSSTPPSANFTYAADPKAGQPVQFTDTSTGLPTSWSWNFGDGGTSTAQNPTHTFVLGSYQVSLTASNAGGPNTKTQTVVVSSGGATVCTADAYTMCMVNGRYKVTSRWKNQFAGGAEATLSKAALTDTTGAFWIFNSATYEYFIRFNTATDNGRIWIAIPTFTSVEFWIAVTDTKTGQYKEYHSPPGNQTMIYDPFYFVYP
jgi:PKD repeat protein